MSLPTGSELDRALVCLGSAVLPRTRRTDAAAERGSDVHLYLEHVGAGVDPEEALDQVEDDEHRALCAAIDLNRLPKGISPEVAFAYDTVGRVARELGRRLGRRYPDLAPTEIAGTADAVGLSPTSVFVGDYKTGHWSPPAAESAQLKFLALAAARTYDRDAAVVEVIRIRENGAVWRDRAELDALDLDAFGQELWHLRFRLPVTSDRMSVGVLPDVVEGEHCRHCPAWNHCPAKATALVRVATGADLDPIMSLLPLSPEMAGHAWTKLRGSRRLLDRLERACYAALDQYGELPLPHGGVLRRVTEPGNEVLDGRVMFAVVREQLDQVVAEDAVEIEASKARLERALKAAAAAGKIPPRGRAATERRILAAVRERGGASRPMVSRVVEVGEPQEQAESPRLPAPAADPEGGAGA